MKHTFDIGTNTYIKTISYKNRESVIIKQYGYDQWLKVTMPRISILNWQPVVKAHLELRTILQKAKINIPQLIKYGFINDSENCLEIDQLALEKVANKTVRFFIIETFTGISYRSILKSNSFNEKLKKHVRNQILLLIKHMPENIELDINPSNFTWLNDEVYFVDMMPPKIQQYQNNCIYKKLFPSIAKRSIDSEQRRRWRYNNMEGRIQRFNFYEDRINKVFED